MAGLTDAGFTRKTLEEILAEIEDSERTNISPTINTSSASVIGQVNGILASKLAELWELAEDVYHSQYPDSAAGEALDGVSAITGTVRQGATKSTATLTLGLDATTTVPAGSVASVAGNPEARFVTLADVTSVGAGNYPAEAEAEEAGPVVANAGTITVIETPVAGWNSVTNAEDAIEGQDEDTDSALRIRREEELQAAGTSPVDALRADLLRVEDVTSVTVFENTNDVENEDGMPGHSFEAVVVGGADQDIGDRIWAAKAAGIESHGTTTVTVEDAEGGDHEVQFTRPTVMDVYLEVDVSIDDDLYPVDGDDQIAQALADFGDEQLAVGEDVIVSRLVAAVFQVEGVVDVVAIRLGFSASPVGTANLTIESRELADLDTGRVEVAQV